MKKLIFLIGLSLCCLSASAQPTSFGGITPGTTTREELKSLVQKADAIGTKDLAFLNLKQPAGELVLVDLENDVVYEVKVDFSVSSPELKQALIEKYKQPKIKVGAIRRVNCQNKFGASFERLEGKETLLWPVKDGVQGEITRRAGNCSDKIIESYTLRHVATVQAIEEKSNEKSRKESEEKRRKLDGAL